MADPVGIFDESATPAGWFDKTAKAGGWFDEWGLESDAVGGGAQTLLPGLHSNAQVFYAATAQPGVVTLQPELLTNTSTFPAAQVVPGAVTLQPVRLDGGQVFYAATVASGPTTLSPPLLSNAAQFFAATVQAGAVALGQAGAVALGQAARLDNAQAFYGPTITIGQDLLPPLVANPNGFFGAFLRSQYPSPAQVLAGVLYGPTGVEFIGIATGGITGAPKLNLRDGRLIKALNDQVAINL